MIKHINQIIKLLKKRFTTIKKTNRKKTIELIDKLNLALSTFLK